MHEMEKHFEIVIHDDERIIFTGAFCREPTSTFPASLPRSCFFYFAVLPGLRAEVRVFLISLYIIGSFLVIFFIKPSMLYI